MTVILDQGQGLYTTLNLPPSEVPRNFVESMGYEYIKESKNSSGQLEVYAKVKTQQGLMG